MKNKILHFLLFCTISINTKAEWNQDTAIKIAAGATAAVGLWSWWAHVSNNEAIDLANGLFEQCRCDIGKQQSLVSDNFEETLSRLKSSSILKHCSKINGVYQEIGEKKRFFWNRSARMANAYEKATMLKKSAEEYESLFKKIKQQFAVARVTNLCNQLSVYGWNRDISNDPIYADTLTKLLMHPLVKSSIIINELHAELYKALSCCDEFSLARINIIRLKEALDQYLCVIDKIRTYETVVDRYQQFLSVIVQPYSKQDIVVCARCNSSGEFPLRNFIQRLSQDIERLRNVNLSFAYMRMQQGIVLERQDALQTVLQCLRVVESNIRSSTYYQDEERYYQEKLCMEAEKRRMEVERERLNREQDRLRYEQQKIKDEVDRLKRENRYLENEIKNK